MLTVDEEIYRLTPGLVIATVDKLAQLPWKAATASLFGLVDTECTRHGWQNPDFSSFCGPGGHPARADLPRGVIQPAMRLRPPDLIIQDELHLISDALGSMVGLYETAIDRLSSRGPIRPVLVASTATVRRARDQVEQVFARGLTVFPPPVLDAGETYFSATVPPSPSTPGRRYRGILAPGERLKSVEIRVASALMEHAQFLFDRYGAAADPYMTLVDYFTATRELAGMRRLVEDDITDRLRSQQVRTRRRAPIVQELTGRMPSSRIAESLADLEHRFDPEFDSTAALDELRRDPDGFRARSEGRARPIDVLLATSMLQVGVDVQRLGLMVVTGQPKNTAEYIQATSRVGRSPSRPGLVVTIYQWSRPRDLAHYESFGYDHAHVRAAGRGADHDAVQRPGAGPRADRGAGDVAAAFRGVVAAERRGALRAAVRAVRRRAARRGRRAGRRSSPTKRNAPARSGPSCSTGWTGGTRGGRPCRPGASGTRRHRTSTGCCASRTRDRGTCGPRRCPCARWRRRSCCSSTGTTAASVTRRPGATSVRPLEVRHDHSGGCRVWRVRCRAAQCSHPDRAGTAESSHHDHRGRRDRRPAVDERDRARPGRVEPRAPGSGRRAAPARRGAAGTRTAGPGAAARAVGSGCQR